MNLHALEDFLLVASHGGFRRASRASGRSKATLSRHVAALEASLGAWLLEHGPNRLRLNDEGLALRERVEGPLAELAEAGDGFGSGGARVRGRLRVSAAVLFSHTHLGRISAEFLRAFPEVRLEIDSDDSLVDPVDAGFDVVIRANPRPDDRLGRVAIQASQSIDETRWIAPGKITAVLS